MNRSHLGTACLAALAATVGDLLMLYVGNSMRPELGLPPAPPTVLWIGALLGVVGIPLYAIGYRTAARPFGAGLGSRLIVYPALVASLGGAAIHGLTAFEILRGLDRHLPAAPPLEAVAASGGWLVALWIFVGAGFLLASAAFALQRWRADQPRARIAALMNPALVTIVLVSVSMPNEWLRSFLAPAAPNAAHLAFFWVLWRMSASVAR